MGSPRTNGKQSHGNSWEQTRRRHIPRRHSTQVRDRAETRAHSTVGTEKCHGNITTGHLKKKKIRTSALSNSSTAICWKREKRREKKKETLGKETQLSWVSYHCPRVTSDSARRKPGRQWTVQRHAGVLDATAPQWRPLWNVLLGNPWQEAATLLPRQASASQVTWPRAPTTEHSREHGTVPSGEPWSLGRGREGAGEKASTGSAPLRTPFSA